MASREDLMQALRAADAAGDTAAATAIATRLSGLQGAPVGGSPTQAVQSAPEASTALQNTPPAAPGIGQRLMAAGKNDLSMLGSLKAGGDEALVKAGVGIKQLLGLSGAKDKRVLGALEEEAAADPNSGFRTAGGVAGNLALTAVPGAGIYKGIQGAKALSALPAWGKALAAGVGSGAAIEGVTAPVEGDSYDQVLLNKSKEAAKAGAMGGAFSAVVGAAGKAATGMFKASAEAKDLFKQNIYPTLQQGAEGKVGKWVGGLTSGVANLKERVADEGAEALLKRVTEGNVSKSGGTGEEYYRAAKNYVTNEYDKVLKGVRVDLSPRVREDLVSRAGTIASDGSGKKAAAEAASIVEDIFGVEAGKSIAASNRRLSYKSWNEKRDLLSKAAYAADEETKRRLLDVRKYADEILVNKKLSPDALARKLEVDSLNFDASRMREAIQGGEQAKVGIDINRLNRAYSKMIDQGRSMGNTTYDELISPLERMHSSTPTQHTARAAWAAIRKMAPIGVAAGGLSAAGAGTGAIAAGIAPIAAISMAGQTKAGSKFLLGQYDKQRAMAEALRRYRGFAEGPLASSVTQQSE